MPVRPRPLFLLLIILVHGLVIDGLWRFVHSGRAAGAQSHRTWVTLELPTHPPEVPSAGYALPQAPDYRHNPRGQAFTVWPPAVPTDAVVEFPVPAAPMPFPPSSAALRLDESVLRKAARESWPEGGARQMIDGQVGRDGPTMLEKQDRLARGIALAHQPNAQDIAQGRERALKRAACKPPQAVGGDGPGIGGVGGDTRWTFTVRQPHECPD